MAVSPAFTGFFFCFAAMVLMIFVSVSAPVWSKIYFLSVENGGNYLRYGIWGYCTNNGCSSSSLGYPLTLAPLGINYTYNSTVLENFTKILILHPIVAGLSLIAMVWGLIGVCAASRACTILMSITAFIALVASLLVLAIDLALWIILRHEFRSQGVTANLSVALWLTVAATGSLLLGTCTAACGSCGRFATGRMGGERY